MTRLRPREQRTIRVGLVVSAVSLIIAFGIVPVFTHARAREALIDARREELARLRGLIAQEPQLRAAVSAGESQAASSSRRVLSARSAALAASVLQTALQQAASNAALSVSSLDVTGEADSTVADALPASMTAMGDLRGVSAFLATIRSGPFVLDIAELRLRTNPALIGQPLQLSLVLHAPWVQDGTR